MANSDRGLQQRQHTAASEICRQKVARVIQKSGAQVQQIAQAARAQVTIKKMAAAGEMYDRSQNDRAA